MSKNTNLSFLTDFLTADIVNSRVGMNNASPQSTFDVTGTGKFSGILTLGSTVSNGTYTYTLPSATGTLALTSDIPSVTGYVPYTGATQAVDLGTNDLTSRYVVANGSPALGGVISMKQDAAYIAKGNGYSSIASSFNSFDFFGYTGASTYKNFQLRFDGLTNNTLRTYTLPDADGTIALVGGSGVGTVTSVAAITLGTSGTDLTSTVANGTTTPVITLNVPDASATARGVITTGTQYIAGLKIFTSTIVANVDLQLPAAGTASTTFIKNINGTGLASFGSNGFGFNNSDNIYFSGSNKGGGVFAFSNTGTQIYTLQNASGTLAFTSQIPTNAVGGTGTLNTIPKFTAATTIGNSNIFDSGSIIYNTNPAAGTFAWQFNGSTVTGQSYGAQVIAGTNASDIGFKVMNAAASINYLVVRGDGLVTLTGALNGTSASFTGGFELNTTGTGALGFFGANNTTDKYIRIRNSSGNFEMGTSSTEHYLIGNGAIPLKFYTSGTPRLTIASTGEATFSSSVTATSLGVGNNTSGFGDIMLLSNTNTNVYPRVNRSSTSYEAGWKLSTGGTDSWYLGLRSADGVGSYHFYSYTTNSSVVSITNGGNVLIGTTTDSGYKLQVSGVSIFSDTVVVNKQIGGFYTQTSASGTTSFVNTGIFFNTSIIGFSNNGTYLLTVTGNPNGAGSSEYRAVYVGYITVTTGYDFGITSVVQRINYTQIVTGDAFNIGSLTISAVFWNGTTETNQQINGTTNNQIRVKITGYNSGNIGAAQDVRINKINEPT